MAHSPETRDKVRRLYVFDRISLEVASLQCGISMSTASRWKREAQEAGDDWDKMRAVQILAGDGIENVARAALAGFLTQYQSTMDALNTNADIRAEAKVQMLASLADSFNKTVSASKRVLPETSQLATAMEVVQKLAAFIREKYPKHAMAFAEVLEPFGDELAKSYG
jgi:transposase-like protein